MRPWRLVALLSATATASYLCRVNVSVAGVLVMRELGLSQEAMGQVFSAFLVGYAVCQIPGGMLADHFGAPRVLGWAALAWVAATGWMVGAGASVVALLGARCALGVAEAPTFPAAAQAISRALPVAQRGRANGLVVAAIGLGSAICAAADFVSDGALGMARGADGFFSARAGRGLRVDVDSSTGGLAGRGCEKLIGVNRSERLGLAWPGVE
jgi:sugar phosphate permease